MTAPIIPIEAPLFEKASRYRIEAYLAKQAGEPRRAMSLKGVASIYRARALTFQTKRPPEIAERICYG